MGILSDLMIKASGDKRLNDDKLYTICKDQRNDIEVYEDSKLVTTIPAEKAFIHYVGGVDDNSNNWFKYKTCDSIEKEDVTIFDYHNIEGIDCYIIESRTWRPGNNDLLAERMQIDGDFSRDYLHAEQCLFKKVGRNVKLISTSAHEVLEVPVNKVKINAHAYENSWFMGIVAGVVADQLTISYVTACPTIYEVWAPGIVKWDQSRFAWVRT